GNDVVLGGAANDTIAAGEGNNVVFGDGGLIDYAAAERGGTLAGDDLDPSDIDRIWSLTSGVGGSDTITIGAGDDIVIGGAADDTIAAGEGRNLVFGDSGQISASAASGPRFGVQPLTL